jgi:hypothetical protein
MRGHTLLALCLVVALACAGASTASTQSSTLSVSPAEIEAEPSDRIAVNLTVTQTGENVTAYIVDLQTSAGFDVENATGQFYQERGKKWLLPSVSADQPGEVRFDLRVPANATGTYELPVIAETADGVQARTNLTVKTPTTSTDSPLEGAPGEFDSDGDGSITQTELSEAAFAFATGRVSQAELSEVAFAFATG